MVSRTALSETLKMAQMLHKQTLTGFSETLGIGRSTLCSILAGKENATLDLLDQIAEQLNTPASYLISPAGTRADLGSLVFLRERDLGRLTPETRDSFLRAVHQVQQQLNQGV